MPNMDLIGWIFVGLIAGALSGFVFNNRTARGCLPNILVGILGGLIGGWIATQLFGLGQTSGFLGALVVAFLGAVLIRFLIGLTERR
jgi:uncharacterized membrane protein YeaQ/YmgE (transglycosylase-associated protein family)